MWFSVVCTLICNGMHHHSCRVSPQHFDHCDDAYQCRYEFRFLPQFQRQIKRELKTALSDALTRALDSNCGKNIHLLTTLHARISGKCVLSSNNLVLSPSLTRKKQKGRAPLSLKQSKFTTYSLNYFANVKTKNFRLTWQHFH